MDLNIVASFNTEQELHTKFPNIKKYSIKDILGSWPSFIEDNKDLDIRDVVFDQINKVLSCRTPKLGGSV